MPPFILSVRVALTSLLLALSASVSLAQPFTVNFVQPTMDRWMYPFNATPGCRPSAPVFGTFGDEAGVDTRHGQFLIGFDTLQQTVTNCGTMTELPRLLSTHQGAANYLLRRVRLTVSINRDLAFRYDPTPDAYTTYFESNHPARTADLDAGRPIELFGVGFRNGYTVESFWEDAPFGGRASGERNAYAAGYSERGSLIDVGNNVGKTNELFPSFEVHPFAIGQTSSVQPGDLVPTDTRFSFDLNLADPLLRQYLQEALDHGRVRLMLTGLHTSEFGGQPTWPDFFTRDSVLGSPPTLEIEGSLVSSTDTDADGLPDDWEQFYFGSLEPTSSDDPDLDGQTNLREFRSGTDPKDAASGLRILSIQPGDAGATVLRFAFAAGGLYSIEYSQDLQSWSAVENPVLSYYVQPGVAEWRDDGTQTGARGGRRFYRVRTR